jgi:predicted unusual protein kinase regulating ubiquinone biosynthesis (AarF/ABC1/UbiB family)
MKAEPGFIVPDIDWKRTARRVMTLEWVDGLKLSDRDTLIAAGHDPKQLAASLVRAFLRQAIADGFFHADLHQGNLFVLLDGRIAAIDFGIMGRIDRRARVWLAEIIHGLITGNYARVAEIHFEAGYVPPHHNLAEFTTALRAVGEPIRGLAVKDISIGQMLDGLFTITRDFDMPTQPHLLLLQKTMVMVNGCVRNSARKPGSPTGSGRICVPWRPSPRSSAVSRNASRPRARLPRRRRCARWRWCGSAAAGAMRWWRSSRAWPGRERCGCWGSCGYFAAAR